MDLMKGSTNFRALSRKYDEFRAPSAEITVGGTTADIQGNYDPWLTGSYGFGPNV